MGLLYGLVREQRTHKKENRLFVLLLRTELSASLKKRTKNLKSLGVYVEHIIMELSNAEKSRQFVVYKKIVFEAILLGRIFIFGFHQQIH